MRVIVMLLRMMSMLSVVGDWRAICPARSPRRFVILLAILLATLLAILGSFAPQLTPRP
ncbi:hypothetical protein PT2222_90171 [Paraburkholderia tropica]